MRAVIDALTDPHRDADRIFRGVAFEFRFKATPSHRKFWDYPLPAAPCATFSQGVVVGAVINGFDVEGGVLAPHLTGSPLQSSAVSVSLWPTRCWAPPGSL
jgi:cytochrome bd-type quinol oxidase subunit 2